MTTREISIGFIGGGNMAHAIVGGLLQAGHEPARLLIADPSATQRANLSDLDSQIQVSDCNATVAENSDALVFAVKPQILPTAMAATLDVRRPADQLMISIAAGITLGRMRDILGPEQPTVRVMPNQPALMRAGMSVLIANDRVTDSQRQIAQYITDAVGQSAWIEEESWMDAVTAVSGSGPAYFYRLMELMEAAAGEMGLPGELAKTLVRQTAMGAGLIAAGTEKEISELRQSVTSPGGTTAAALSVLNEKDIASIFRDALFAARDRSVELNANDAADAKID
jgi:pyrroline-5-carboxylate reductase